MTTQTAEQLATAIVSNTAPLGVWDSIVKAAAMLRSQAALIERQNVVINAMSTHMRDDAAEIERLRSVLHQLACLGNGDIYGNSIGNSIARAALEKQA